MPTDRTVLHAGAVEDGINGSTFAYCCSVWACVFGACLSMYGFSTARARYKPIADATVLQLDGAQARLPITA